MGMMTGATAEESNSQQNAISNMNTEREHFPHFGTVGANPFRGFGIFRGGNNNLPLGNNNNPPSSYPPSGFGEDLREGFNLPSGGNAKGLDLNVAALVNALTEANLGINHVEREFNHVKPTEFEETEAEDFNEWLECYNRIAEVNK